MNLVKLVSFVVLAFCFVSSSKQQQQQQQQQQFIGNNGNSSKQVVFKHFNWSNGSN